MNTHQVSSTTILKLRNQVLEGCHQRDEKKVRAMSDNELLEFVTEELGKLYDFWNEPRPS